MGVNCKVSGCFNKTRNGTDGKKISYFKFPRQQARFDEWVRILEISLDKEVKAEEVSRGWKVCSNHFDPSMFVQVQEGILNLKSDAVPKAWYDYNKVQPVVATALTTDLDLIKNNSTSAAPSFGKGYHPFDTVSKRVHDAEVAELKKEMADLKRKFRGEINNLKNKLEKAERREEKLKIELKEQEITEEIIDRKFQRHRQIADMIKMKLIPRKKLKNPIPTKRQKLQGWADAIESAVGKSGCNPVEGDGNEDVGITTTTTVGELNSKEVQGGCGHLYHDTIAMVAARGPPRRKSAKSACSSSSEIVSATPSVSPASPPSPTDNGDGDLTARVKMEDTDYEIIIKEAADETNTDTIAEIPSDLKFLITIPP